MKKHRNLNRYVGFITVTVKYIMRISFVILLFSLVFQGIAQNFEIKISGVFPGAEGQIIRLMEYDDQISYREKEITWAKVQEDGSFELDFSRFETRYVYFRIDHARMGMFVEPGNHYELLFDAVDFAQLDDSRNPYLDPWYFAFEVVAPADNLNNHINAFEDIFQEFLLANFARIHQQRNRSLFDIFRLEVDSLFAEVQNEYFENYVEYTFAYYYRTANLDHFLNQMRDHLLNRPVLYHNTQYMNFFNSVFDTYIFAGSRNIRIHDLKHTVNELNSYDALMDSLGKDTILRNEVIRELVMLKALDRMYDDPDYRKRNVEHILNLVSTEGKFPEHRKIAANILHRKHYLTEGYPAPSYTIIDEKGYEVTFPDDFSGKFIYMGFWATWCESCLLDLIALDELADRYKENYVFINISTDRNKALYDAFVNHQDYPWENYHFNGDFRFLDAYHIRNLPSYILLDENGIVLEFPARRPSDDLMTRFEWYLFQKKRKSNQ